MKNKVLEYTENVCNSIEYQHAKNTNNVVDLKMFDEEYHKRFTDEEIKECEKQLICKIKRQNKLVELEIYIALALCSAAFLTVIILTILVLSGVIK